MQERKDELKSRMHDERVLHAPPQAMEQGMPGAQGAPCAPGAQGAPGACDTLPSYTAEGFNVSDISTAPIETLDTLQIAIRQWLTLDTQMKQLLAAVKERRKLKNTLDANII